jgi:ligand-binding sensor domain-containing protein
MGSPYPRRLGAAVLGLIRWLVLFMVLIYLLSCGKSLNQLQSWNLPLADPPELQSNIVIAIHQSPDGTLWFGTYGGGASNLDPASGQWRSYTTQDGLAGNEVRTIHQSADGALWFGTYGGGVSRLDLASGQWRRYTQKDGLADNKVWAIHQSPDGTLWFGTYGGGVSRLDLASGQWRSYTQKDGLAGNQVWAIHQSADGALWFGTTGGVSRLDPASGQWRSYTQKGGLADNTVFAIHQSPDGVLWFGTGGGASRLDPASGQWRSYTQKGGLADNTVFAIHQSADGVLWFGTTGGVSRLDPVSDQWRRYTTHESYTTHDSLAGNVVRVIHQSADGALWFGMWGGGVSRLDPASGQWRSYTTQDGLADNKVLAIYQSANGALWFGTPGGVSRLDPASGQWRSYTTQDGLADNAVLAIHQSADGALWFGTPGGVSRLDPASSQWRSYTTQDGLADNAVRAIHQSADGALWFGTPGWVSRLDPASSQWRSYTQKDGLVGNEVLAIHQSPNGALWFGTPGGVSRLDPASSQWRSYTQKDGLAGNEVLAIHQSPNEALWFGTPGGVSRMMFEDGNQAGQLGAVLNLRAHPAYTAALAIAQRNVIRTYDAGLVFSVPSEEKAQPAVVTSQEPIRALAAGPAGSAWTGERLGGLHLRKADGSDLQLTEAQGLPAMDVSVLTPVTPDGSTVWAGTAGGAVRITLVGDRLKIGRTVTYRDGLPTGPVAALAARADGAVFLAYNALDAKWFFNKEFAQRRGSSRVCFVSANGSLGQPMEFLRGGERLAQVEIRALALAGETLWAGTSAGLFRAEHPTEAGTKLELVATPNSPQAPIHKLKAHPQTGTLWMIADAQEDVPARVIGYDPARDTSVTLGTANGIPSNPPLHDFDFTEDGELVVLAGAQLIKGFVAVGGPAWINPLTLALAVSMLGTIALWFNVFRHPLVVQVRKRPEALHELSLSEIAIALQRLKRARALDEVWQRLGLSKPRLQLLRALASTPKPTVGALQGLATLLGMDQPSDAEVRELRPGLWLLNAQLSYLEPLRGKPIPLIGVDPESNGGDNETRAKAVIQQVLEEARHRFELPFLLFCRDTDLARRLIPDRFPAALIINDPVLRDLLFASNAQQTFAGLLLTRGLLALSPYSTAGEVRDPAMFYGRDRLLRELMQAKSLQFLLVGPRRVGKTSLLRRLKDQLPNRRPELQTVLLDLLGINEPVEVTRRLARALKLPAPVTTVNARENAVQLAEMLRGKFTDPAQPGLILIDEADGLVEADAAAGFPLLSKLRSLQAEGLYSFILAGYWYLFRGTLDHSSPVYNFATVKRLGPLESEAARNLAVEPMARLGLRYADTAIPAQIVENTGGYPSLIQFLCDQILEQLKKDRSLVLTADHLAQVEQSQTVRDYLSGFFHFNTGPGAQLLVYRILESAEFSFAQAHGCLEQAVGKSIPLRVVEQILLQLVLYGLVAESGDRYRWTIPLVRETLLAGQDREHRVSRLLRELPVGFAAWITPPDKEKRVD